MGDRANLAAPRSSYSAIQNKGSTQFEIVQNHFLNQHEINKEDTEKSNTVQNVKGSIAQISMKQKTL